MPTSAPSVQRVLFVDDEPAILSGLARMLRPLRNEIQSEFANSAAEALNRLEREPFDVVIADIRMPVMDGAALLDAVARAHPHIIRMVASAHADVAAALRSVPLAQQFLPKPCDAASLRAVLSRAGRLHRLLHDEALLAAVASLGELPARPKIHLEISQRLADPSSTSGAIAQLIERDSGLTRELLRSVNRPFFGSPRRVVSIESAINYVGTNMLRALILDQAVRRAFGPDDETRELLVANLAMQFFNHKHLREDAFAAALLRDVGGRMVRARAVALPLSAAQLSAHVLAGWGLPYTIVEAVAHQHEPNAIAHEGLDLVDAVNVSTAIVEHQLDARSDALDLARAQLERFGASDRVDRLCRILEHWLAQPQSS